MDYTGQKFLQNCGDYLIIDKRELDFYGRLILKDISKNCMLGKTIFLKGMCIIQRNPINMDFSVMRNTQIKTYTLFGKIWSEDPNDSNYSNYGAKGVEVSDEFKVYSKFKNWYINNYGNPPYGVLEIDKDCLSILKGLPNKMYSAETCLLIPSSINTFRQVRAFI